MDKEKKIVRKEISLMHTKNISAIFKNGFNLVLGSIPRLPFSSSANAFINFYSLKYLKRELFK